MEPDLLSYLLSQFDLGTSTAENDPLLESAKIETQEYNDLYVHDRIDIIRGIKGAGKTALYRVFYYLQQYIIEKKNIYCVFGVEPSGDPIFKLYRNDFEKFNQVEFENFWGVYFIALVHSLIHENDNLQKALATDLDKIDELILKLGLKFNKGQFTRNESIRSYFNIFGKFKSVGVKTEFDQTTGGVKSITPAVELDPNKAHELSVRPIYLAEFRDAVANVLSSKNIRIWVMLDRLDEIFPHRSDVEKSGLRSLLKASYNFSHPNLRIKIFMRDDVIGYLAADGFTALTHVTDRSSTTMSWSKDELVHLIVKRLSFLTSIANYYDIDKEKIDNDKHYRETIFYTVFPSKIGTANTIEWLYANCADGNNIVTPRDMIDFFRFAKSIQFRQDRLDAKPRDLLLTVDTFKKALDELSVNKKDKFLFAEFPHLKSTFLKFEGSYSEYNKESLEKLLGAEYLKTIDDLRGIGFLKHIPKSGTYKIPVIWRSGLNIRRGKAHIQRAPRTKKSGA